MTAHSIRQKRTPLRKVMSTAKRRGCQPWSRTFKTRNSSDERSDESEGPSLTLPLAVPMARNKNARMTITQDTPTRPFSAGVHRGGAGVAYGAGTPLPHAKADILRCASVFAAVAPLRCSSNPERQTTPAVLSAPTDSDCRILYVTVGTLTRRRRRCHVHDCLQRDDRPGRVHTSATWPGDDGGQRGAS